MTHERLASLWSLLSNYEDLTVCIRDAAGEYALNSSLSRQDASTGSDVLLTYAVELITIFDFIRASNSPTTRYTGPQRTPLRSTHVLSALTYLLHNVGLQNITNSSQKQRTVLSVQIIVRVTLSAICAINSLEEERDPGTINCVANAARDLASQLPLDSGCFSLLRNICGYIVKLYCKISNDAGADSEIKWRDIYSCNTEEDRSTLVDQLVRRAINSHMPSDDRMQAIIQICHAYWESETFIIQSCVRVSDHQAEQSSEDEVRDAIATMETRFLIQDYVTAADSDGLVESGSQDLHLYLLFMPGLASSCTLDRCRCAFKQRQANLITDLRKSQSRLLRSSLQKAYKISPLTQCSEGYFDIIFDKFEKRLQLFHGIKYAATATVDKPLKIDDPLILANPSSQQLRPLGAEHNRENLSPIPEERSQSLPNLNRRFSRPRLPTSRTCYQPSIEETVESAEITTRDPVQSASSTASESGLQSQDQRSRTNSMTTVTLSSRADNESKNGDSRVYSVTQALAEESYKIAVDTTKSMKIESSWDTEINLPEVAVHHKDPDSLSLMSEDSTPMTNFSIRQPTSKSRWGNLLRSKKDATPVFILPKFRFFASGKHILLWTKYGAGYIDPSKGNGYEFTPIHVHDINHAAGGTTLFVLISRLHEMYKVSIFRLGESIKVAEWDLPKSPSAIDISRDDRHLALKYTPLVRLYDLQRPGFFIDHRLSTHDNSRSGLGNHLVSFSHDSQSFMASTRFQPERVYTYWSNCAQSPNNLPVTVSSSAPFGHVDDHGLTSLTVCGATSRSHPSAFLSTFTEKGNPVVLTMSPSNPSVRLIRDPREQIGTRIHSATMTVDTAGRSNLVLVNQNNNVFWVTDVFGRDVKIEKVNTLKRPKSLKNEIQVAMSDIDEASVFWVDKTTQTGVLVKVGKNGGKAQPLYFRLEVDPLCGG